MNRQFRLFVVSAGLALGLVVLAGNQVSAQEGVARPIGRFVVDVRGSIAAFGQNQELSAPRGFSASLTPKMGLGVEAGAHVYLYRWRQITFGLGGTVHASMGDRSAGALDPDLDGPTLRKRFVAVSPQLSFNFGNRNGWSYISRRAWDVPLFRFFPWRRKAAAANEHAQLRRWGPLVHWRPPGSLT